MDLDMSDEDPWDDDMFDKEEELGMNGCKWSEYKAEDGSCRPIEELTRDDYGEDQVGKGGYEKDEFGFDDNLDDFVPDMLDQENLDDSDYDDIQEYVEESVGISPTGVWLGLFMLFTVFLCVVTPICYMMRREGQVR